MKKYLIAGVLFGLAMMFLVILLFTIQNGFSLSLVYGGIVAGFFAGFLFSVMFLMFVLNLKDKVKLISLDLQINEVVLMEAAANHVKKLNSTGGKLFLTNQRLLFKAHGANLKIYNLCYNLQEIVDIEIWKVLGLMSHGLIVIHDNFEDRFMVEYPEIWLREIGKVFR